MNHRGKGVKVVGLLLFLASETHWLSVKIGSILRLDNIFISFSFSDQLLFYEIVIFLSRVIS